MDKEKRDWITYAARAGYGSKTVVYSMLGIFAVIAAFGTGSTQQLSQKGVFQEILEQPFGKVMLILVTIGLFCYAFWRFVQVIKNTEDLDSGAKGIIMRGFYILTGLIYAAGGVLAIRMLMGGSGSSGSGSSGGGSNKSETLAAQLMGSEWGLWLVAGIGLCIIAFGLVQIKHAWKVDFMDKFELHRMSDAEEEAARKAGRLGYAARFVVYVMVGSFFVQAALTKNPEEAGGMKEALTTLMQQPYGPWLLGLVGAGLLAFGIFCGFESFYRKTRLREI